MPRGGEGERGDSDELPLPFRGEGNMRTSTPSGGPFNPRLVIGLIAAGLVAFAALLLLLAYGGSLGAPRGGGGATIDSSAATGFKGLVTLTGRFHATSLIRDPDDLAAPDLVVVAVQERTTPADLSALLQRRLGRPTLLVLPKWITRPDPGHPGWVRALGPGAGAFVQRLFGGDAQVAIRQGSGGTAEGSDLLSGLILPLPDSTQTISGDELTPIVRAGGGALIAQYREQPHYVLADPDLLNNHGLRDRNRAAAALDLIAALNAAGSDRVHFDLTLTGLGAGLSPNALRLAFEPPFLVLTLALLIAALLAGLHGAFRFGPVRPEKRAIPFGKAALVENSAGLIRLAGREAHLGAAYADVIRAETARAAAMPAWLQGEALDAQLDRLGRGSFTELAAALGEAQGRQSLTTAARALHQWKQQALSPSGERETRLLNPAQKDPTL